jgi:fumarate reductase subunit C
VSECRFVVSGTGDSSVTPPGAQTGVRAAAWRFVLQRASAAVLAVCVVVHLASIVYATRSGLSAEAIVARMHANPAWPAFYAIFVVAVAIHAPLGLRAIADEWLSLRGLVLDVVLALFALVLLGGGLYAIRALAG